MSDNAAGGNESNDSYGTRGPSVPDELRDAGLLHDLYHGQGLSLRAIGNKLGCGTSTVKRWLRHHGIEARRPGGRTPYQKLKNAEWLREEYRENRRSAPDIADDVGCSADCVRRWLRRHGIEVRDPGYQSGDDLPQYIDGRSRERKYGGALWHRARRNALRRDDYTCQRCGMGQEAHTETYGNGLEVHHITPFRTFDEIEQAHELSNLITLCRACHKKMEGLPIDNRKRSTE